MMSYAALDLCIRVGRHEEAIYGGLERLMKTFHFDSDRPRRQRDLRVRPWALPPRVDQ